MYNRTGTETERKISVVRSLFYRKQELFCDPYRTCMWVWLECVGVYKGVWHEGVGGVVLVKWVWLVLCIKDWWVWLYRVVWSCGLREVGVVC